jgi:polysaccharide export outer membrane protein
MSAFTKLAQISATILTMVLVIPCGHGQQDAAPAPPLRATGTESLPIGAGDVLQISVLDEGDLQQSMRVNDGGQITANLLGQVSVAGLTPFQAADVLRNRYISGGFLTNPQVSVLVMQSFHQSVSVLGEVAHPGAVELTSPRSLLDVIALAGGFDPVADRNVTIRRGSGTEPTETVFLPNDTTRTVAGGAVLIYPGDAVIVPKAGIVYVLGNVARPGGFVMQNDSHMTLLQAVALAGGPAPTAAESRTRLVRHGASGYSEQTISLTAYEKGKIPDFELQKDDVIWVPFSYGKNIAIGAGSILAGTGSALIYTVP